MFFVQLLFHVCSVSKHTDSIISSVFLLRRVDSDGWKEFITKPSLPYALRLLAGLCSGHDPTQVFVIQSVDNVFVH